MGRENNEEVNNTIEKTTWRDQIAAINARTSPDKYGTILKGEIIEETEQILSNISNDKISSLARELNISETIAKQYLIARQLYLSLNQRVSYDGFYANVRDNSREVYESGEITENEYQRLHAYQLNAENTYNRKITFETMRNSTVVCHQWAALYYELLVAEGISSDIIKHRGTIYHSWIEINLGDNVIIADATEAKNEFLRIRRDEATRGFLYGPASIYEGKRIKTICDGQPSEEFYDARGGKNVAPVDKLLGYGNTDYLNVIIGDIGDIEYTPHDMFSQFIRQIPAVPNMDGKQLYNYIIGIAKRLKYFTNEISLSSRLDDNGVVEYIFEYTSPELSYKYSLESGIYDYAATAKSK